VRITVIFHGILGKLCPGKYEVEANNAFEALRIVCKNNEKKLTLKNGHQFKCFVKECPENDDLYKKGKSDVLNVIPSFCPSGGGTSNSAWKQTAIIAALVVIAVVIAVATGGWGAAAVAPGFGSVMGSVYASAIMLTIGTWMGALSQHIANKKKPDQNETQQNYAFGLNGNTVVCGTAIPIAYGRYKLYGHLLSMGTEVTAGATPLSEIQSRD
jgi:predicted phage tail protein